MKSKILTGCICAAALFGFASCSDFLEEDPKGTLTPNNFFNNKAELTMSVNALYAKVQAYQCNSNPMITQCQGDDVTSTTGSNKSAYLSADAFETPSDTKGVEQLWSRLYSVIQAANLIIDNASSAAVEQEEINIALGQAYYWRAYAYFNLVRMYGPLPMNLHNDPTASKTELTSVEGVYQQIVADLTAAENCNLPAKYTGDNRVIGDANVYVSVQAVKATLAAVYLNMAGYPLKQEAYYAKAAAKAKEVIDGVNNGTYPQSLLSDWSEVYSYGSNHHNETILGIDYSSNLGGWSEGDSQLSSCHQLQSVCSGWGDFLAERRYWAKYPEGPRKDAVYAKRIYKSDDCVVDWWATTDGKKYDGTNAVINEYRPMFIGFTVNTDGSGPIAAPFDYTKPSWGGMCINKRHLLIRYSEVLLWFAEASAHAGTNLTEAKAALKQVRERAYADPSAVSAVDAMSAAELEEAAFNEHGYEVAGNVLGLVTRRADQFRKERLQETHTYRKGSQTEVLVPAGTLTHSYRDIKDSEGNVTGQEAFTYTTTEDVVVPEEQSVTSSWNGESSIYMIYPPTEVNHNPNLKR